MFTDFSDTDLVNDDTKAKVKQYANKYRGVLNDNNNFSKKESERKSSGITTFKLLIKLPQPAHLIVLVTVIYLGFVFFPKEYRKSEPGTLSNLVYIGSFATHFGSQMWMTFVSGIVLFFTIPRHNFGQVQRILFPKYFLLNAALGLATLTTFVHHHPSYSWTFQQKTQAWALAICFVIELATRLYIVPPLLETLSVRMLIEQEAGVGGEIGRHEPGLLKDCPNYMKIHRKFRKWHLACGVANVAAVGCNGIHLYHLATKLCAL